MLTVFVFISLSDGHKHQVTFAHSLSEERFIVYMLIFCERVDRLCILLFQVYTIVCRLTHPTRIHGNTFRKVQSALWDRHWPIPVEHFIVQIATVPLTVLELWRPTDIQCIRTSAYTANGALTPEAHSTVTVMLSMGKTKTWNATCVAKCLPTSSQWASICGMFTSLHWTTLNERRYVLLSFERSVSGVCATSHKRVLGLNERPQQFTSTFSPLKIEPKSDKVPQDETAKRHI